MVSTTAKGLLLGRCQFGKKKSAVKGEGVAAQFPGKLHDLMDYVEQEGLQHIISWTRGGRAFKVHEPKLFVDSILPIFFDQTKYRSFQRQLYMWHFKKIWIGRDKGSFFHPYFKRGEKYLCKKMSRDIAEQPKSLFQSENQLVWDVEFRATTEPDVIGSREHGLTDNHPMDSLCLTWKEIGIVVSNLHEPISCNFSTNLDTFFGDSLSGIALQSHPASILPWSCKPIMSKYETVFPIGNGSDCDGMESSAKQSETVFSGNDDECSVPLFGGNDEDWSVPRPIEEMAQREECFSICDIVNMLGITKSGNFDNCGYDDQFEGEASFNRDHFVW